jgi:hypothetical protein
MESQLNQKVTSINIFVNSRQIPMNTSQLVGLNQICGLEINLAFTKKASGEESGLLVWCRLWEGAAIGNG